MKNLRENSIISHNKVVLKEESLTFSRSFVQVIFKDLTVSWEKIFST